MCFAIGGSSVVSMWQCGSGVVRLQARDGTLSRKSSVCTLAYPSLWLMFNFLYNSASHNTETHWTDY